MPYLDADGDPVDPTALDSEVSQDNGTFADAAEEVTLATGSRGMGMLTLTGAEMNNSAVGVWFGCATAKATLGTFYPDDPPILYAGTATAGASGSITLPTTVPRVADLFIGAIIRTTGGTGGGGTGGANNQARRITAFSSAGVATVLPAWETTPDNTTTFDLLLTAEMVARLQMLDLAQRLTPLQLAGVLDHGTAVSIANGYIDLRSGHGLGTLGSVTVYLVGGTDANGKSRTGTLSGDRLTVDPAWNAGGESLPSGTITYVAIATPPAATSSIPTVNAVKIGGTTQTGLDLGSNISAIVTTLTNPAGAKKNTAIEDLSWPMRDANGNLVTGLTVTGLIQKDGGAFAALTGAIAEVASAPGTYQVTTSPALTATEMNANQVMLVFSAAGAKATVIEIYPEP